MIRKIRKNDTVIVVKGKEKGKRGKVLKVLEKGEKIIIEKTNIVKRHRKKSEKYPYGGIVDKESPVHVSNVRLLSKETQKPVKIKFKIIEEGSKKKKIRIACKTGEIIE